MRRCEATGRSRRSPRGRHATPEIFNTDQGSQFTSFDFTGALKDAGVAISMDGRGRCMDNIFIERLRRSLKYEAVYLHELTDGFATQRVIDEWIDFYNTARPHSALDGRTPAEAYGIALNWPPFGADTRHSEGGLGISSSTGLCRTSINGSR